MTVMLGTLIETARRLASEDPATAAIVLRDLPESIAAGINDMLWLLCRDENYPSKNDVLGVIEDLEEWLRKTNEQPVQDGMQPDPEERP